jgi:uncharacterized protein YheU (UPF0270 family)
MSDTPEPIELDPDDLTKEAVRGLAESFVAREGTDYGLHEKSWEEKVEAVLEQLDRGEARIVFDPESETATLIPRR